MTSVALSSKNKMVSPSKCLDGDIKMAPSNWGGSPVVFLLTSWWKWSQFTIESSEVYEEIGSAEPGSIGEEAPVIPAPGSYQLWAGVIIKWEISKHCFLSKHFAIPDGTNVKMFARNGLINQPYHGSAPGHFPPAGSPERAVFIFAHLLSWDIEYALEILTTSWKM